MASGGVSESLDCCLIVTRRLRPCDVTSMSEAGQELGLGDGPTMQCARDVLLSGTLEACMVLSTNVTPIHLIFKEGRNRSEITVPAAFVPSTGGCTLSQNPSKISLNPPQPELCDLVIPTCKSLLREY